MTGAPAQVVVEADGGSRGNPGPAAYGALVRDPVTGEVLAQVAETIGVATNNVAEYRGLIAGLRLAGEVAPDASIEVRMDSKLVVEQMAGRWKIKHADLKPLANEAQALAPFGTEWTWVPRERNSAADALANLALDGRPVPSRPTAEPAAAAATSGTVNAPLARTAAAPASAVTEPADPAPVADEDSSAKAQQTFRGWGAPDGSPTQLILLRHGETPHTVEKRFSGFGGVDPELNETGLAQARAAADYLTAIGGVDAVVSSPMRRTRQTAEVVAGALGLDVAVSDGWQESSFGEWEGYTFAEVQQKWPEALNAWLGSTAVAPPGGESLEAVDGRVRSARDAVLASYAGKTVVVVSHVTPIKLTVRTVLEAPLSSVFRMELRPASITEIHWYADGLASLRSFNVQPALGG